MASARVKITVDEKEYELYFGMVSASIFQQLLAKEYLRIQESGIEAPQQSDFDEYKQLAMVIHAGLCNMADIKDEQRPQFIDSYSLAEEISKDKDAASMVDSAWNESQPVVEMIERLKSAAAAEEKKSQIKSTGKKLKPTHSVS